DGNKLPLIGDIKIPCFQKVQRIKGTLEEILAEIKTLKAVNSDAWLEITYTGNEIVTELRSKITSEIEESDLKVLIVKNNKIYSHTLNATVELETLASLSEEGVFQRCLDQNNIDTNEQTLLMDAYRQILVELGNDEEAQG
ncbi:MAG TPA: exonuclease sbcCD subunit D, partial [Psychromonas hadalis]|nr:exonuclease sbcCD subunit D [Psychromonas hadalis]